MTSSILSFREGLCGIDGTFQSNYKYTSFKESECKFCKSSLLRCFSSIQLAFFLKILLAKIFRSYQTQTAAPVQTSRNAESKILRSPGFLKPEALVKYLGKMDSITQQQMQSYWEGNDVVKAFPLAKTLTLSLACRFFLGTDDPERIARLIELKGLGYSFPQNSSQNAPQNASSAMPQGAQLKSPSIPLI
ncbi:beta-amyrin 28-monooxygenase [Quercus suber]|uniref:Beta-amyrin 28-monooxygenase n=1 Tax=Quercus suber TaxID=58331 RepID=A0AAW0M4F0_QUESU